MGAAGAALATVSAQAVSMVCSQYFIRKKPLPFSFSKTYIRLAPTCVKGLLRVGIPMALQDQFPFLFIQIIVNGMGVTQSAAAGVAENVCVFFMLVVPAYIQARAAFVAQNNGAGLPQRSRKALFYGIETALLAGAVMGPLVFGSGALLSAVFSRQPLVIVTSYQYPKAYAIDCLLTAVLSRFVGYFNGCGRTVFVMVERVVGAFCVRIPAVYFIGQMENITLFHIGLTTRLSSLIQLLLCVGEYRLYPRNES